MAGDEQIQKSAENVEQKTDVSKLTDDQKEQAKRGYAEWVKEKGHDLYESWTPWAEDWYLRWFTKDNKASYATKQQLDKTKVTNIEGVNKAQDDLNSLVSGQIGKGGMLQPVGDAFSKEGINRAERNGKDEKGNYLPDSMSSVEGAGKSVAGGASEGAKTSGGYLSSAGSYVSGAGSSVYSGAKGAAGYVGGMFGGKKDATPAPEETQESADETQDATKEEAPEPSKEETENRATETTQQATKNTQPTGQRTRSMIDQAEEESKLPPKNPKTGTSGAQQATQPVTDAASKGVGAVQDGGKAGVGAVQDGVKAGGGYLASAGNTAKGAGGRLTGVFGKKS